MEKYISAEIAQRLKALGFKERVLTYYENGVPKLFNDITGWDFNTSFMTCISRPTFSQAFRWFRVEHKLYAYIRPRPIDEDDTSKGYMFRLEIQKPSLIDEEWEQWGRMPYETFDEAELACLEKLISIVELKQE